MVVAPDRSHYLTKPMVRVWEGLLRRGIEAKKEFNLRCQQIEYFYSGPADFMWDPSYMNKFMGGATKLVPPKFQVPINKAFEYVAVMKPMLFWQMATRKVRARRTLQLDPYGLFGVQPPPPDGQPEDPQMTYAREQANELAARQADMDQKNTARAEVLEHALNYFQSEEPGGGLANHINSCLDDALLKGVAFMMTKSYRFPSSERTLVQSERVDPNDVLVDPDSRDPLWLDAKWVAVRHTWSFVETEKYFNLPPGSLKNYTSKMTTGAGWQRGSGLATTRTQEQKNDLIEWWEIFSRAGCGNQLIGSRPEIEPEFDDAVAEDNCAYLCIVNGCPFPLNLPSGELVGGIFTEEQAAGLEDPGAPIEWVTEQLRWPTEYWRDRKWPITKLAFYPHSTSGLWPEPPLASAIGELTALNILSAAYVQTAWDNRQQIIGVMRGMVDNLPELLSSGRSPLPIELNQQNGAVPGVDSVNKMIQFMQRPEINQDVPKTIQFLMGLIEQRTGMSPRLFGENSGAAPRSAAESTALQGSVNLRPEYMRKCVAEWQSAVADLEVFCAWSHVQAEDIAEILGPLGIEAWRMLVTDEEPEAILRGCKVVVEASEIARPNKERDAQMLERLTQTWLPVAAAHNAQHNDPRPVNGLMKAIGVASDIDVTQILIPEPEPDNQAIQMQQAMSQAELEKTQAEAAKLLSEAQNSGMMAETAQQDAAIKAQQAEHQMSLKEREAELKAQQAEHQMAVREQESSAKLAAQELQTQGKAVAAESQIQLKTQAAHMTMAQRQEEARQKLMLQILQAKQGMQQKAQTHQQAMTHDEEKSQQEARHTNLITFSRMLQSGLRSQQGAKT